MLPPVPPCPHLCFNSMHELTSSANWDEQSSGSCRKFTIGSREAWRGARHLAEESASWPAIISRQLSHETSQHRPAGQYRLITLGSSQGL